MSKCPNKNSKEWKTLEEAMGAKNAFKVFLHNNRELPDMDGVKKYIARWEKLENPTTISGVKKKLGIPTRGNQRRLAMVRKKLRVFNAKQNTSHSLSAERIGQSTEYNFKLTLSFTPVNKEAQAQRDVSRRNPDMFFNIEDQTVDNIDKEESIDEDVAKKAELEERLMKILTRTGIEVEVTKDLMKDYGLDVNGVADLANRIIKINDTKHLPEEAAHMIIRMLPDDNFKTTLFKLAKDSNAFKKHYNTYIAKYGSEDRVVEEVAGKLLGEAFKDAITDPNPTLGRRLKKVADYIWRKIKNIFSSDPFIETEIDFVYQGLAQQVLNEEKALNPQNLSGNKDIFFSTEYTSKDAADIINNTKNIKTILEDAVDILAKKIAINKERDDDGGLTKKKEKLKKDLEEDLENKNYVLGIFNFLDTVQTELIGKDGKIDEGDFSKFRKKERKIIDRINNGDDANDIAKNLKIMHQYYAAYKPTVNDLAKVLSTPNQVTKDIKKVLTDKQFSDFSRSVNVVKAELDEVENSYLKIGRHLVSSVLQEVTNEPGLEVATALDIIKEDESLLSRTLYSMADSRDPVSRIIDKLVKQQKDIARRKSLDLSKDLINKLKDLEAKGIKNTKFIYEKHNGELTGHFIDEYNRGSWIEAKKDFDQKTKGIEGKQLKRLLAEFYAENGNFSEPSEAHRNYDYDKLTDIQKEYLNEMVAIKRNLDKVLPTKFQQPFLAPQFRQDLVERVKNGGLSQIGKSIEDAFVIKEDETEFGKGTIKDETGKEVKFLPIYGNTRIENPNVNLSTDITATLAAYGSIVNDYAEMNKVIHTLEITKDLVAKRKVVRDNTPKGKKIVNSIKSLADLKTDKELNIIEGVESNNYKRLVDYYDMIIYGQLKSKQGSFTLPGGKEIDRAKTADAFGKYVAANNLAVNVYAGINNVVLGNTLTWQEAITNQYFSQKNLLKADAEMLSSMDALKDIGSRKAESKLMLWAEYMNVLQDYETEIQNLDTDRKTKFGKLFKTSSLFALSHMGEFQIQMRSSIALAKSVKLKASDGRIVSLYNAFSTDNGKLILNDEYIIEDGGSVYSENEIGQKFTDNHVFTFTNLQNHINQELHGIYNTLDKNAIQKGAVGRLVIMFRKFLVPAINRRFREKRFNEMSSSYKEGYYLTAWEFIKNLKNDVETAKAQLVSIFNTKDLTEEQLADAYNLRRAFIEIAFFLSLFVLTSFVMSDIDLDDDDWALSMMVYQTNRLYTEIAAFSPTLAAPKEFFRIVKSPAAAVNQAEAITDLVGTMLDFSGDAYTKNIKSGPYKGYTKFHKSALQVVPLHKTIKGMFHPEEKTKFFSN